MSLWQIYLRVLSLLGAEKWLAITLTLGNLLLAGVFFLEPWLFGQVVDALANATHGNAWHYIGLWAAVGFGGVAASVFVSLYADRLAHRRRLAVMSQFFAHAIGLPLGFHGDHHTGRLLRILHAGSSSLFSVWLGFFREHLSTALAVVVMMPLAWRMNWKLALLMIALMTSFAIFNTLAIRRTHRAQGEVEQLHHAISERAGDVLGNVLVVQSFTRIAAEVAEIKNLMRRVLAAQYPVLRGWAWLSVANRAASTLTIVAIFALGTTLNQRGEVSVGAIVSFVGFAMMMVGRLEQLAGFISGLFFQTPALRDFFAVLDTPAGPVGNRQLPALGTVQGDVRFENVSFAFADGHAALQSLSFHAPPGATIALVGPTGAGKTTALSMLYVDSLRRNIAVVFQDAGLFYRSIVDNLRVGNPEAGNEQIEAAARAADAHDFIVVKPGGYATLVAERGRSLSGGERQRLAIARAMLKDAPILILDEATSALDNSTEARIQQALQHLTTGRTTFVIAHRLSTVRSADLILVLKDGCLVEQGRYAELVALGGVFAELDRQGQFVADATDATAGQAD